MAVEYDVQAIMNELKKKKEMDEDSHDGSYELMRKTVEAYSKLEEFSALNYKDLNLIYLTTVGTWKQGIEKKKQLVNESHLQEEDKISLIMLWDEIWHKAVRGEYTNYEQAAEGKGSIGLFGTGFFSFQGKTSDTQVQAFIKMCADILPMSDDDKMFDRASEVLTDSFKGMRAASASMILHCLKPCSFPILNSNMGNGNIFETLGVELLKPDSIETYIYNCRKIKAFRDNNFTCRNYRIFDIAAGNLKEYVITKQTGIFDSWEIIDENTAKKTCDKSFFQYKGSAIPTDVRWFFGVEKIGVGEQKNLVLIHDEIEHSARIQKTDNGTDQVRMFWDSALAEKFSPYESDGKQHVLQFSRLGENRFTVIMSEEAKSSRAWLLTWNRAKWYWEEYAENCESTKAGQSLFESWSCSNRNPKIGDEVFLMKLGEQPRGLIGHGWVTREIYEREHYDSVKASGGKTEKAIDVEFDRLLNYELEKIISQEELMDKCAAQHWSPQSSGVAIKPEVLPSLRVLWSSVTESEGVYGFAEMISFLENYAGKHYIVPSKARKDAQYMADMKQRGQEVRQKFIAFGQEVANSVPGLEFVSCSKWINQGQVVQEYLWIELKNKKWKNYPHSVSLSIEKHGTKYPGEGYFLSVRADTRDASSKEEDFKRQERLLDLNLQNGMFYEAKFTDGRYYYLADDKDRARKKCEDGTVLKLEVVKGIEELADKDIQRTILPETVQAAKEIQPFYEYVMVGGEPNQDITADGQKKAGDHMNNNFDHNIILYGPPGTGKTYNSVNYAVAICEGRTLEEIENEPYGEVLKRYRTLKEEGRIAFTTFHQAYGYEEFIEGIKPKLNVESEAIGYTIEDGIFKRFCNRAKAVKVQSATAIQMKSNPRIWGMILGGTGLTDLKRDCFENNEIRLGWSEVDDEDVAGDFVGDDKISWNAKHMVFDFISTMEIGDIVVIEKNNRSIDAIGVIAGEYELDDTYARFPRRRKVEWLVKNIDQDMLPFLPNGRKQLSRFSLFAFDYIGMDAISQILNDHSAKPMVEVERETKPYVFIIDEINRGNISKIFGELISLIEDTKRAGSSEAMEAILPYSGEAFSVPNNVYLLGTMNTADRSIALMDTALRRRFSFEEMMPKTAVLEKFNAAAVKADGVELNVAKMLDVINERIEYLFDREHTIGHAYFMKLAEKPTLDTLADIFEKKVIPLLQEYFYEDYEKIQLILGDNTKEDEFKFVLDKKLHIKEIFNGSPEIDIPDKGYIIQHDAFRKIESYKQIGKDLCYENDAGSKGI